METTDTAVTEGAPPPEEQQLDMGKTWEVFDKFPSRSRRYLIPILQEVQAVYRFLPEEATQIVMEELGLTRAEIYGVISFYPQLRCTEPGKYIIKLCYGTACFVKGADIIADKIHECYHIRPGETDETKLFTLETASCLGNCGAAPMALVGDDTYGTIDPEQSLELLACYKNKKDEPVESTAE